MLLKFRFLVCLCLFTVGNIILLGRFLFLNTTVHRNKKDRPALLIITSGRSGSSFLGNLLKNNRKVIYHFEPLNPMLWVHNYNISTIQIAEYLDQLFSCNISWNKDKYLNHKLAYSNRIWSTKFSSREDLNVNITALNEDCRSEEKLVVVKVLQDRIPLGAKDVLQLLKHDNVKVIQLVRDPRATLFSMARLGWKVSEDESVKKSICDYIFDEYNALKSFDSFEVLRYEDLCENLIPKMKEICNFVGLNYTQEYNEYLFRVGNVTTIGNTDYSIERNIKLASQKWRATIPLNFSYDVEEACQNVMDSFGYIKLGKNRMEMLNLSVPVYKREWKL